MTTEPQNTPGAKGETKHTPLPWEVHEVEDAGEVISRGFRQVGGMGINTGEDVELFSKADAEFIANACNAHDVMVVAIVKLKKLIAENHPNNWTEYDMLCAGSAIDAALAKANGGAL